MSNPPFEKELAVLRNRRRLSWLGSVAVVVIFVVLGAVLPDEIDGDREWVAVTLQMGLLVAVLIPVFVIATAKCPSCGEGFFVKAKSGFGLAQIRLFASACVSCHLGLRPPESGE